MKLNLLFAAVVLTAPALASADSAEDHVTKGTRSYNIQDWANALKEYRQAYSLDPKPETLWAIAQTQRLSGDCRGAILTYKAYVRGASAAGANAADEFIKQCQADLTAQQTAIDAANTTEPAKVVPVVTVPPPVVTPPPPAAPKPQPEPRSWAFDPLGDTLFVLGVGGLVTGGTFLVLGDLANNDASREPTWGAYSKKTTSADNDQKIAMIASAGGAVFLGLAIWRFAAVASRSTPQEQPPAAGVAVIPTLGGAFASYTHSF